MVEREGPLSLRRQCQLLRLNRGAVYYEPVEIGAYDLELMSLIDRQYLRTPFYGSRRMTAWLQSQGHAVNRKRVQRLMQRMGLEVIYQRPRTSRPGPGHRIYPYLLRGLCIERVHQVWAADITYIPMAQGFLYLVAVMDWVSRYVLAWRLSNLLEASFCIEALEEALGKGRPEIFNTDQGSQFTDDGFTSLLRAHGVCIKDAMPVCALRPEHWKCLVVSPRSVNHLQNHERVHACWQCPGAQFQSMSLNVLDQDRMIVPQQNSRGVEMQHLSSMKFFKASSDHWLQLAWTESWSTAGYESQPLVISWVAPAKQ